MGARGPKPTPKPILEARGSWRSAERSDEPVLPVEVPSCPAWLDAEARAEWKRQAKHLVAMRVITAADRATFAGYCEAWSEFVRLCGEIEKSASHRGGYTRAIATGLVAAKNKSSERFLRFAQQLGLSPSARARVKAAPEPKNAPQKTKSRFFHAG
jgi:P27 family predicted phage terminase small subunit